MRDYAYDHGDPAFLTLLQQAHDHGSPVSPRGQLTHELEDVTISITDPLRATPNRVRPRFNERIAATELVQLLAGVSHLGQLDAASNGNFNRFANDGRLRGAYGPRLYQQLPEVERRLRADPDTRQAIATLWRPDEGITNDVPCTLSLTFRIRDERLSLKVHMRSNDVWLGLPYDWYVFSRIQLAMAEVLDLPVGPYVHHVDSLHLYERNFEDARQTVVASRLVSYAEDRDAHLPAFNSAGVRTTLPSPHRFSTWRSVQRHAWWTLDQRPVPFNSWFDERITSLPAAVDVCDSCRYVLPLNELSCENHHELLLCTECDR